MERPLLIHYGVNATSHRIHNYDSAGVITERVDCYAPNFRIFTSQIVFRDERLHLLAHRVVDRDLTRDSGTTSSFSTPPRLGQSTSIPCFNATQRHCTFTL